MAKKKEPTAEDLEMEKFIKDLEKRHHRSFDSADKKLFWALEKTRRRQEEEARKRPRSEVLSPEDEEFLEMQRRAERKAVDLKYGIINYPKLFLRIIQIIATLLIISHLMSYLEKRKTTITTSQEPSQEWSYEKDVNKVSMRDLYGDAAEAYCSGILQSKSTKKKSETVRIRPVAHGKYPGEYTIEYQNASEKTVSSEDLLDQIDQEDILDYMDGNID